MWRVEVAWRKGVKSLEEWAFSKLSIEEVTEIAESIVLNYVEGDGINIFDLQGILLADRDQQRENVMCMHNYLLLYEELSFALNVGDIGCFETLFILWIQLF